jgi:glucosamine 6-phosphate synthetase-like amidotransferase/phosphosugar isomerase protein
MCGIFGVSLPANSGVSAGAFEALCNKLLLQSESRGKEAAGIALIQPDQLTVYKRPVGASELIRDADYKRLFASLSDSNARDSVERPVTVIGHARMVTDGFRTSNKNNQPVVKGDCAAIHNGIIVNVDELWNEFPQIEKQFELDSEVIPSLIQMFRNQGMSLIEATCSMFSSIKGMASISVLFDDLDYMLLATNNGSLYVAANEAGTVSLFASEKIIITQALARHSTVDWMRGYQVEHLEANNGQIIKLSDLSVQSFSFQEKQFPPFEEPGIKRPIEVLPLSQNTNGVSNFLPDKPLAKEFISHFEKCDRWIESR